MISLLRSYISGGTRSLVQLRTFKNFGHGRPKKDPLVSQMWYGLLLATYLFIFIDFKKLKKLIFESPNKEIAEMNRRRY